MAESAFRTMTAERKAGIRRMAELCLGTPFAGEVVMLLAEIDAERAVTAALLAALKIAVGHWRNDEGWSLADAERIDAAIARAEQKA